jgi:hypothetical protein
MNLKRYARVSMRCNVSRHNLEQGDVGTVVDFAPDPDSGEDGCVLEFYNATGELLAKVTVSQEDVQPLQFNEVLCVRKLLQPIK